MFWYQVFTVQHISLFIIFLFFFYFFLFCGKDKQIYSVLFCSVLFCAVLFCSVLFCAVPVLFCLFLCCSVPFRSVPFRSVPFRSVPFRSVPFRSVPFRSVPFRSVPFRSVPFRSVPFPFRSVPFRSVPFRSVPFRSVLFYSILLYSILFYSILFYRWRHTATSSSAFSRSISSMRRYSSCSGSGWSASLWSQRSASSSGRGGHCSGVTWRRMFDTRWRHCPRRNMAAQRRFWTRSRTDACVGTASLFCTCFVTTWVAWSRRRFSGDCGRVIVPWKYRNRCRSTAESLRAGRIETPALSPNKLRVQSWHNGKRPNNRREHLCRGASSNSEWATAHVIPSFGLKLYTFTVLHLVLVYSRPIDTTPVGSRHSTVLEITFASVEPGSSCVVIKYKLCSLLYLPYPVTAVVDIIVVGLCVTFPANKSVQLQLHTN